MLLDDDDNDILVDKEKLVEFLIRIENGALANAYEAKPHIAVKAYAQAAAFKYVCNLVIAGEFDLIDDDMVIN